MSTNTAATFASVSAVLVLIAAGLVLFLGQLVGLNDFDKRAGLISIGLGLFGLLVGLIVAAIYANRLTRRFIEKNNLNSSLAMIGVSFAGIMLGLLIAIVAVIVSVLIAVAL